MKLGLSQADSHNINLIGLIHDIGKIGIPAELLSKPTRLSNIEYELIKTHVTIGYEILKNLNFMIPVAEIVREHHERIDGSGYPQGLKGDQILMEARILAVADTVEAMSAHRPYRPALGIDAALAEIEQGRGTKYEPRVVDACLELFRKDGYQIPPAIGPI
jgi:putative nucleotidyltransferase with HDIG domain